MKKIILMLAITITSVMHAFAGEEKIDRQIMDAFHAEFTNVEEVNWVTHKDFYEVSFSYQGKKLFAFYNTKGELLGVMHYLLSTELPEYLQSELKKHYAAYWISDLFELKREQASGYFITLQNADKKIVLVSKNKNSWEVFNEL